MRKYLKLVFKDPAMDLSDILDLGTEIQEYLMDKYSLACQDPESGIHKTYVNPHKLICIDDDRQVGQIECPVCGHDHLLALWGWTAIHCHGCDEELYLEGGERC